MKKFVKPQIEITKINTSVITTKPGGSKN